MTTSFPNESAKIYTFPLRGRFAVINPHHDFPHQDFAAVQLPPGVTLASGGAWYHDEAIQTDQGRKN